MLLLFTARKCKVNGDMPHVLNGVCTIYTSKFHVWDERFKRYGCSEPGMFSDFVYCDSKRDSISRKEW